MLVALIPLFALSLVVIGYLDLRAIWSDQLAPRIEERSPITTFVAIDRMVGLVLSSPRPLWLVLGAALTLWEVSGSVRAVMGATNRIFESSETRGIVRRFALSFALASGVIACLLGAGWAATLTSEIPGIPGALELALRWLLATVLLWLMVLLLLRFAPAEPRPVQWASLGSAIVVASWLAASAVYAFYVQHVVTLESAFGFVSVGLVTTGYVYTSAIVFLVGVQVDELLRRDETRRALRLRAT